MSIISQLKSLAKELELLEEIRSKLNRVRLIHESYEETFDRIMKLALTCICKDCRGYGRQTMCEGLCKTCNGTGNLQGLDR